VFVLPEFRRYSSRPIRKCAFRIVVLSLLVSEHQRVPILVDQSQFVGELFALMDFGVAFLFYFEDSHRFHGAPARDVPVVPLSKDTVEQACRSEEAHMTRV
jgi:hypothetical protein